MKTIRFIRIGEAVGDFDITIKLNQFLDSDREVWDVSTHSVLNKLRVYLIDGRANADNMRIVVEDVDGHFYDVPIQNNRIRFDHPSQNIIANISTEYVRAADAAARAAAGRRPFRFEPVDNPFDEPQPEQRRPEQPQNDDGFVFNVVNVADFQQDAARVGQQQGEGRIPRAGI